VRDSFLFLSVMTTFFILYFIKITVTFRQFSPRLFECRFKARKYQLVLRKNALDSRPSSPWPPRDSLAKFPDASVVPAQIDPLVDLSPPIAASLPKLPQALLQSLSAHSCDELFHRDVEQIRRELNGYDLRRKLAILWEAWELEEVSTRKLHSISEDDGAADATDPALDSRCGDIPHGRKRLKVS